VLKNSQPFWKKNVRKTQGGIFDSHCNLKKTERLIIEFQALSTIAVRAKSCCIIERCGNRNCMEEDGNSSDLVLPLA